MDKRFNVRVYGIWIADGRVLVNEELIRDKHIIKFPGGGLEWGEGLADGLRREWQEELGLDITISGHFYTTDFFQASAYDNSQVISIYYLIDADKSAPIVNRIAGERTYWMRLEDVSTETFTLAIDRIVGGMLRGAYTQHIGV